MAQVFDSCHLLPSTLGEEGVLQTNHESCAWSCSPLSLLFPGAEKSVPSLSSSWEVELWCSRDAMVVCVTPDPCNPPIVCCLLNIQLRRCLLITVKCCTPVPAAVRRALRGATDQSLRGSADGTSGCQGARSFPALFVSCSSPEWPRIFADPEPCDLPRFPHLSRCFNSEFLSTPFLISVRSRRQR